MNLVTIGQNLEIDIDFPVEQSHSERRLLLRVLAELKHQQKQIENIRKNMITPEQLKASSDALTTAVTGAIALITTPAASTPDATVKAFQSDVDAQTARLTAAEAPPAAGSTTAATP